jgi:hypothetical protein
MEHEVSCELSFQSESPYFCESLTLEATGAGLGSRDEGIHGSDSQVTTLHFSAFNAAVLNQGAIPLPPPAHLKPPASRDTAGIPLGLLFLRYFTRYSLVNHRL